MPSCPRRSADPHLAPAGRPHRDRPGRGTVRSVVRRRAVRPGRNVLSTSTASVHSLVGAGSPSAIGASTALHENHGQPAQTLISRTAARSPARRAGSRRSADLEVDDAVGLEAVLGARDFFDSACLPIGARSSRADRCRSPNPGPARRRGLPAPRRFVTIDDVPRGKPDPAPVPDGRAKLGVDPAAVLVVEDAVAGRHRITGRVSCWS